MSGIKISDLPAAPSSQLTDVFPADQGSVTYKESLDQVMTLFEANIVIGPNNFSGILPVSKGGTGNSTFTAYSVICAGVSATDPFQNVSGVGTVDQVLTSNGAGLLPTWQTPSTALGQALTRTDDTNVTLTLTGMPTVALLEAVNIAAGWTGQLSLARGGTNANLTASNGGIFYSTATAGAILSGTATAGQVLQSGATAAPSWSTATYPAVATNAGRVLRADGTNWVQSTSTFSDTYTASNLLYSNGANTVTGLATANNGVTVTDNTGVPSILAGPGATGRVLTSNTAAAPSWSTATFPGTAGPVGTILRSDGTNWVQTTSTFADTYSASTILYSNGANTVTGLATANDSILKTSGAGVPSLSTDIPTAVTIGGAYIYRVGGTDVSLADGGTNASLTASNGGIFYSTSTAGAILAGTATAGLALLSGASTTPSWSTSPPITQVNKQVFVASGTYTPTTGTKYCIIECVGSGGGGGGTVNAGAAAQNAVGGGGSGSYSRTVATAATIGASQTVTVNNGGTAGANTGTDGGAGGDVSVGTICVGKGGSGGAGSTTGTLVGGAGGVAGTGDITTVGNSGGNGIITVSTSATGTSGFGAGSYFGGSVTGAANAAGKNGANYGAGGSGAASLNAAGAQAGGTGAKGAVFITEFISI